MSDMLLPYETIYEATHGNSGAIQCVLKHFEAYIITLSKRKKTTQNGVMYWQLDEDIKRELEIELITKLSRFNCMDG